MSSVSAAIQRVIIIFWRANKKNVNNSQQQQSKAKKIHLLIPIKKNIGPFFVRLTISHW